MWLDKYILIIRCFFYQFFSFSLSLTVLCCTCAPPPQSLGMWVRATRCICVMRVDKLTQPRKFIEIAVVNLMPNAFALWICCVTMAHAQEIYTIEALEIYDLVVFDRNPPNERTTTTTAATEKRRDIKLVDHMFNENYHLLLCLCAHFELYVHNLKRKKPFVSFRSTFIWCN